MVEVSGVPRVTIGLDENDSTQSLVRVAWAVLSSDSLLIVGDVGARRIGAFSLDGAFRRWIGRTGEGPGEFRSPRHGGLTDEGEIWVFDPSEMRVLVYRPDGVPLQTIRIDGDAAETTVLGVDSERGVWVKTVTHFWALDLDGRSSPKVLLPGQRYRPAVRVLRFMDESMDLIWEGEGDDYVVTSNPGGVGSTSDVLAPRLLTALMDGVLVITRTDSSSIETVRVGEDP
ncbi:MAG: 6-bladed beta-propeller, partial [Longimicrobiales bacterium]